MPWFLWGSPPEECSTREVQTGKTWATGHASCHGHCCFPLQGLLPAPFYHLDPFLHPLHWSTVHMFLPFASASKHSIWELKSKLVWFLKVCEHLTCCPSLQGSSDTDQVLLFSSTSGTAVKCCSCDFLRRATQDLELRHTSTHHHVAHCNNHPTWGDQVEAVHEVEASSSSFKLC